MSQFEPGVSGNPNGRPRGIKDRRTMFAEMINPHKQQLFDKAIGMALDGNEAMLKLFLSRLLPPKPKDETVNIGVLQGSLVDQCKQIFAALEDGLTPSQCATLIQALGGVVRVQESEQVNSMLEEALDKLNVIQNGVNK